MHTGRPFLWQIYPQAEHVHIEKLQSFLKLMQNVLTLLCVDRDDHIKGSMPFEHTIRIDKIKNQFAKLLEQDEKLKEVIDAVAFVPELKVAEVESGMRYISEMMMAYNDAPRDRYPHCYYPTDISFSEFEEKTRLLYRLFAIYLCCQDTLAERIRLFIDYRFKHIDPFAHITS